MQSLVPMRVNRRSTSRNEANVAGTKHPAHSCENRSDVGAGQRARTNVSQDRQKSHLTKVRRFPRLYKERAEPIRGVHVNRRSVMSDTMFGPVMTWKLDASVMKVSFFR